MKDLSLFALDIAQNSIAAGATRLSLTLEEKRGWILLTVEDNGCGMSSALLAQATDPFTTTRTTRSVGLGLALLKEAAVRTGGDLVLDSTLGVGTRVSARFQSGHIDCVPRGDMGSTISLLVQGSPALALAYTHALPGGTFRFDTAQIQSALGPGGSLSDPEVVFWVRDYIREQEQLLSDCKPPVTQH